MAESCNFSTDSCKFPTEKIMGAKKFQFCFYISPIWVSRQTTYWALKISHLPHIPPKWGVLAQLLYFSTKTKKKSSDWIKFSGAIAAFAPCHDVTVHQVHNKSKADNKSTISWRLKECCNSLLAVAVQLVLWRIEVVEFVLQCSIILLVSKDLRCIPKVRKITEIIIYTIEHIWLWSSPWIPDQETHHTTAGIAQLVGHGPHGWARLCGTPDSADDAWAAAEDRSTWRALRPTAGYAQQWVSEWVSVSSMSQAQRKRNTNFAILHNILPFWRLKTLFEPFSFAFLYETMRLKHTHYFALEFLPAPCIAWAGG